MLPHCLSNSVDITFRNELVNQPMLLLSVDASLLPRVQLLLDGMQHFQEAIQHHTEHTVSSQLRDLTVKLLVPRNELGPILDVYFHVFKSSAQRQKGFDANSLRRHPGEFSLDHPTRFYQFQ
jgi:hypothetical protein